MFRICLLIVSSLALYVDAGPHKKREGCKHIDPVEEALNRIINPVFSNRDAADAYAEHNDIPSSWVIVDGIVTGDKDETRGTIIGRTPEGPVLSYITDGIGTKKENPNDFVIKNPTKVSKDFSSFKKAMDWAGSEEEEAKRVQAHDANPNANDDIVAIAKDSKL